MKQISKTYKRVVLLAIGLLFILVASPLGTPSVSAAEESGSIGLEGRISAPPPATGATISLPRDGTTVTDPLITVSGICPDGLLVKIFRNNVFAGATQCVNGSFSLQIDLFNGRNEIVARVYDDLDQAGPDSNIVVVNYAAQGIGASNGLFLTSSFAKRGANPGQTLTWPIVLSGGIGPYAITVDWGDGKTSDLISLAFPGAFNISHIYDSPGVYNIVIRATDSTGRVTYLQLVGVANGPVGQNNSQSDGKDSEIIRTKILWLPAAIAVPLIASSFWLGKRYQLYILRKRLEDPEA